MKLHLPLSLLLPIFFTNHLFSLPKALAYGSGDGFIRRSGVHFVLNGNPYYANGFNAYWLMYIASEPSQRYKVSAAFHDASSRGLSVARTWAFSDGGYRTLQYSPGSYNEQMFQGLDFVLAEARKYGIRLILSLVNDYDNFGGKKQYADWGRSRGQYLSSDDDFFRNQVVKGFYKNHVNTVLNRYNRFTGVVYKNDPTIMAWELINEPRCPSDTSGSTIQAWIMEMSGYVKSIDRNHLLEIGSEGFYGQSSPQRRGLNPGSDMGTDFINNNKIPWIDFATVHAYPDQCFLIAHMHPHSLPPDTVSSSNTDSQLSFMGNWLDAHVEDVQNALGKPLLLTEFGKSWKDPGFSTYQRDQLFNLVYNKVYTSAKRGGAAGGSLFWQLLPEGMGSYGDGYEVILSQSSSTANLIAYQSRKLYLIRKIFARMRNLDRWRRARAIRDGGRHVGN